MGKTKAWVNMDSYEEGRPISVAPLELTIRRLGYYLAVYCANMPRSEAVGFLELSELEEHDLTHWRGPGRLNPFIDECLPRVQAAATKMDRARLPLSPKNFLRGLKTQREEVDYLRAHMTRDKLLLQEHFEALAISVDQKLNLESHKAKRGYHERFFYELAELRDSIYYEWTPKKLKLYLELSDELMSSESYERWYLAAENLRSSFDSEPFPTLEEIRELRDELEVRSLLSAS